MTHPTAPGGKPPQSGTEVPSSVLLWRTCQALLAVLLVGGDVEPVSTSTTWPNARVSKASSPRD